MDNENLEYLQGDEILKDTIRELLTLIRNVNSNFEDEVLDSRDFILTEDTIDDICVLHAYCDQVLHRARFCVKHKIEFPD